MLQKLCQVSCWMWYLLWWMHMEVMVPCKNKWMQMGGLCYLWTSNEMKWIRLAMKILLRSFHLNQLVHLLGYKWWTCAFIRIPKLRHYTPAPSVPIILIRIKLGKHLTPPFIEWISIAITEGVVLFCFSEFKKKKTLFMPNKYDLIQS